MSFSLYVYLHKKVKSLYPKALQGAGFDLTFQKWFVSFPNENNS